MLCSIYLQELLDILADSEDDGQLEVREETCHWFNFITAFIFNELRDSPFMKRCACVYICIRNDQSDVKSLISMSYSFQSDILFSIG